MRGHGGNDGPFAQAVLLATWPQALIRHIHTARSSEEVDVNRHRRRENAFLRRLGPS
ncbi:MAG: hypothetical protein ACI9DC_003279 [Gammaproteobacteria bacterium]|jgi:hypothetical protein